jgi:putative cell wall-binding protein
MTRPTRLAALIAAVTAAVMILVFPAVPAAADVAVGPPGPTQGQLSGTFVNGANKTFNLMLLPITGADEPQYFDGVTTNGTGKWGPLNVEGGYYHLWIQSADGSVTSGWYTKGSPNTTTNTETNADKLLVMTGESSSLTLTLATDPITITGTVGNLAGSNLIFVAAYPTGLGLTWPTERYPIATQVVHDGDPFALKGLPLGVYDVVLQDWTNVPQKFATTVVTVSIPVGADLGQVNMATLPGNKPSVQRLAGADRYGTALAIAQAKFPSAPSNVFIVNGTNFPDALSAVPAATFKNAPILLVKPTALPSAVKNQLAAWNPAHVWIIGGPGSVSDAVKNQIDAVTGTVHRVAGADRYETSRAVATTFFGTGLFTGPETYYLANGAGFADALAAGPAAAIRKGAVILVKGTAAHLDTPTKNLIKAENLETFSVQLAGGTGTISNGIDQDLYALMDKSASNVPYSQDHPRRAGADRYTTAAEIVDAQFGHAETVYLAIGSSFPDALAGGAAAGKDQAPILLVRSTCIPWDAYQQLLRLQPNKIYLLGGTGVISNAMLNLPAC